MNEVKKPLYFWNYVAYGDNECPSLIMVRFLNLLDCTEHECSPSLWNRFMAKLWKQHGEGATAKF